ncbi:MAG: hypothetical protein A3I39_03160 [Candidatus Yanofskybacteria bacterium RIFCSPLOWO2_02_FULL_47_9b]|uniref:DUF86 domain-containing protein n=1 Tax=Candidatus Yanofskybacteria bacterium RIFCSPLOWO2_02_FULL_47_9b TaxID=1802708 RepID=A0A1F8H5V7_9BACT|nr:MAG: hypothetical protein A3I39_03160 [Candidatus Yanofskybacteria bacterium RIFCSPLOWO2_02_FULL_47_9b]
MNTEKDPRVFLNHITESIEAIERYAKGQTLETFLTSLKEQDAMVRRIEIIGEAVKNLPKNFKIKHPKIPWKKIAGMRDILIHEYFLVDLRAVWDTSKDDLPILKKQIKDLLKRL